MEFVNCPECGKELSDQAQACPDCGVLMTQEESPKNIHIASLILSVIGLICSILLPAVTYPCSIVGLVMAIKNRAAHKMTAALVMCIISLVIAVVNSVWGAYLRANGLLF